MSAAIICKNPSEFMPLATFTAIPVGGTSNSFPVVIESTTYKKVDITGSTINYSVSQSVPQFKPDWVITSETPAVCTVAENLISRVANGTGIIRLSGPSGFSVTSRLEFASGVGTTNYVWTGFSGASKSSQLSTPILSLLSASKDKNYYAATYALPSAPATPFPRNPNCWAAPMDLTGSAIATTLGGATMPYNSGALITPRHWVGVAHWGAGSGNMGPGAILWFADAAGNVYSRTVLQRYVNSARDQIVCLLDSGLPTAVKPFKFAGVSMFDFPNKRGFGMGWQILQNKLVTPVVFDKFQNPANTTYNVYDYSVNWASFAPGGSYEVTDSAHVLYPFQNLLRGAVGGDSGGAIGGYYNGETYLVSLFTGSLSGTLYSGKMAPEINAAIATLDAAQGISTGYTVGVLEVI